MKFVDDFLYNKPSVLIPRKGTLTNIMYVDVPFWSVDTMFFSKIKKEECGFYTFYYLKTLDFKALNVGSAVPSMTTNLLNSFRLLSPDETILKDFNLKLNSLFKYKKDRIESTIKLKQLEYLILSKMTKLKT
jgi:type I restriction enzyme S subunit